MRRLALLLMLACCGVMLAGVANGGGRVALSSARPLQTGLVSGDPFEGPEAGIAFRRVREAGASVVRLGLLWRDVAPAGAQRPTGFDAADPADPAYNWTTYDRLVRLAIRDGLTPIGQIYFAPAWAQGKRPDDRGSYRPSPTEFGRFARAAALRYSGTFGDLPRVRLWQAWDEPNASTYLTPQLVGNQVVSAAWYRQMVNAFADAVHGVHRDNTVVAGGLSPFTIKLAGTDVVGPLRFMRAFLCMSKGPRPRSTCGARARFDVWSTHPYTSGGPTHHASNPDDVSLGDLPEMRAALAAAGKLQKIVSSQKVRFWVTEFSWDTNPPDPYHTVPLKLHARWVAEALYRMWSAGVSLVVWLQLRDNPYPADSWQSGLYFRSGASLKGDRPKPGLAAFRFPFVAFRRGTEVSVWGRTPTSRARDVIVEQRSATKWSRLAVLRANAVGIFTGRLSVAAKVSWLRARLSRGGASVAFSLTPSPDRFVLPFGGGGNATAPGP